MPTLGLMWDLTARDAASPAFLRVAGAADKAATSTEAAAVKTEASASRMSSALMKWAAPAALVGFAYEAVKMAAKFQSVMLLVQTQAGASADEVRKMTPAILSLSGKVAQAPEALALSLYHVESTGLRGKAALEAVKIAAEGAAVGHADLEETTNALTATIASGMVPATESFAQVMGQLNTIVGSGDMKLQDLNDALGTGLLAIVKQYGVTLNDVGAALADFGDNNIRGADAATMVRLAVQAISAPSVKAGKDLATIGLSVEQLQSDQQTGGLNKALTDLHKHLESSGLAANKWGGLLVDAFTKKAGGGIITLIGTFDRFQQKYKEVSEGGDKFGAAWEATTHTLAFQTKAFEDNIKSLTTSVGTGLTPAITGVLTWVNQDGIPILEHLGSGAQNVGKLFGDLPGPIREVALALGGIVLVNKLGLFTALETGAAKVGAGFSAAGAAVSRVSDQFAVQQGLAAMEARSLSEVDAALGGLGGGLSVVSGELTKVQLMLRGWDVALAETAAAEDVATAANVGFSDSLAMVGSRLGAATLSGMGKIAGFLGGPWGVALAAGTAAFIDFSNQEQTETDQANKWADALKKGGDAAIMAAAQMKTALHGIDTNGFAFKTLDTNNGFLGSVEDLLPTIGVLRDKVTGTAGAAAKAQKAFDDWKKSLSPSQLAAQNLADATDTLDKALKSGNPNEIAAAQQGYTSALKVSNTETERLTRAQVLLAQGAPANAKSLALIGDISGMNADQIKAATKALDDQVKGLEKVDAAFVDPLKTYQDIAQKMAQATADSTKNSKDSWKDYVDNVKVDLSGLAASLEKQLRDEENWHHNLVIIASRAGADVAQQFADMGVAGAGLTAQMATATGKNFDRMAADMKAKAAMGGEETAKALQEGMAIAGAVGAAGAKATVQGIAAQLGLGVDVVRKIAAQYGLKLAEGINPILYSLGKAGVHVSGGGIVGQSVNAASGTSTKYWAGGYTGDGGKYTPAGIVHAGEFVMPQESVKRLGVSFLGALAGLPGYAGGGFVSAASVPHPYSTAPYRSPISTAGDATMGTEYAATVAWLNANLFTGGGGGAGSPAIRALGQQIAASMGYASQFAAIDYIFSHESGWNPTAQNPTSTAYGIPQFLDSTWGPYGGKTSNAAQQIRDGIMYMRDRYGSPNAAASFWQGHHWYDNGGWLKPGLTMAYNGTGKPERIRTAEQEAALGGGHFTGTLVLDSGQFLGTVRGVIKAENDQSARNYRSAR